MMKKDLEFGDSTSPLGAMFLWGIAMVVFCLGVWWAITYWHEIINYINTTDTGMWIVAFLAIVVGQFLGRRLAMGAISVAMWCDQIAQESIFDLSGMVAGALIGLLVVSAQTPPATWSIPFLSAFYVLLMSVAVSVFSASWRSERRRESASESESEPKS